MRVSTDTNDNICETLNKEAGDYSAEPAKKRFRPEDAENKSTGSDITASESVSEFINKDNDENLQPLISGGIVKDLKNVVDCVKDLKNDIVEMVASFGASLKITSSDQTSTTTIVDKEAPQCTYISESVAIHAAKDLSELLVNLKELRFSFDPDAEQFTCDLCSENPDLVRNLYDRRRGIFTFDIASYYANVHLESGKQPRNFINLKKDLSRHIQSSQIHLQLKEKAEEEKKIESQKQSRNQRIGLNLFNIRYNGILHGASYLNFETDVLTAHLNGTDTGDINNGSDFAKDLTGDIVHVI